MVPAMNDLTQEYDRLMAKFTKLQDENTFWLQKSIVHPKVFLAVSATAVFCSFVYVASFMAYNKFIATNDTPSWKKTKTSYQMTNMTFNIIIGSIGVYYHYVVLPTLPIYKSDATSVEKIPYLFDEFYFMPSMQLGYQIWSIPMGLFVVNENAQMIFHHLGVVFAATLGAFSTFGFRYWLPFFFGVFEISSIPLAAINTFNDHREAKTKYPLLHNLSRISFFVSFLYIRIYLWLFVGPLYIRNDFFLFLTTEDTLTKAFVLIQWIFGLYLGYLQLYWGWMVAMIGVRAVKNFIFGNSTCKNKCHSQLSSRVKQKRE